MRTPVDSKTIVAQAFGYKYNQPTAQYVITSNFQKLRFYIDDAVAFEEFDLFALTETDFSLLYLCLHKEQLLADVPKQLKIASIHKTEQITHQLYLDYSKFKDELYTNLKQWNRQYDALTLFKKSQKLLDRFLFFCFAKDKGLLPAKTLTKILEDWDALNALDESKPLYAIFKKYFRYLNDGFSSPHLTIFGYNGGLFAPDPLLDSLKIPDGLLYSYIPTLGKYDFDSDVDTNILGHIFEHSLNELDEKTAQAIGQTADKSKTKRKKEGIFYTPRSITQYMVEQTIGALCQQKQTELAIDRLDWWEDCPSATAMMRLHTYRGWLLQLTVLDPACGSGAFLNQAFVFLRAEHRMIDAMLATLTGKTVEKTDWATHILDHNLFGVDINEESVEIAKLSLWLRTAKVGRKLNDLSANIQIGNSLIEDPEIAGDLAFDWQKAFPQVFEKGGFDVVIGNPPYGATLSATQKTYLADYDSLTPDYEIYYYFITKGIEILTSNGLLSFIFPNTFLSNLYSKKFKVRLLETVHIQNITDLSNDNTFADASVRTCILNIQKAVANEASISNLFTIKPQSEIIEICSTVTHQILQDNIANWLTLFSISSETKNLILKIKNTKSLLQDWCTVSQGLIPYDKYRGHDEFTIKNRIWHATTQKDDTYKQELKGADVARYRLEWNGELWISYGKWLAAPRESKFFTNPRILVREIVDKSLFCTFTDKEYYNTPSLINVIQKDTNINLIYVLGLLNSKLIGWYHYNTSPKAKKGLFPKILVSDVRNLPVKISSNPSEIIEKTQQMLSLHAQMHTAQTDFLHLLTDNFTHLKVNRAIESWHEGDFAAFKKTLEKQKRTIPLKAQKEWREMFASSKTAYQNVQTQIATTDKAIDAAVYTLYELTAAEIQLIENQ
ncbi:MAG: hypothetical protein RL329_3263 [Bacteroidota bacterium]